jgi:hypothetical protein
MKFRMLALAGAVLCFAGAAWADDPMANTYANTVNTRDKSTGQASTLYFNQDMTYTGKTTGPNGQPVNYTGTWLLKDGGKTICLAPSVPAGTPNPPTPSCSPLEMHNVGDSWVVTNDQNQSFDVSITAGR